MSNPEVESAVAEELVAARREGRSLRGFPGVVPASMAEAYRIQDAAIARWPDTLVGWKIGYIAPDLRAADDPDRLVGPIWGQRCHRSDDHELPVEVGIFAAGFAAVEAELVVRFEQDLAAPPDGGWTAEDVAQLDQQLLAGIEVASSPIPDINDLGPTVIAADFGNNNGLVLGPTLADLTGADPIELACYVDGRLVGQGSAGNLPGGMHHGLATALNVLAGRGQPVGRGMVFATGAITGIHPIRPGQRCRVEVLDGESVELRTTDVRDGS
jgi:2-keto-4-pentenoate hydratase